MSTTSSSRTELSQDELIVINQIADPFAKELECGRSPDIESLVAHSGLSAAGRQKLREELVGEEFAHKFGDDGRLRYCPVAFLGEGAFGAVYKATDERLERLVAMKVLLSTDSGARERFRVEARRQAKMPKHPNLIAVYDSGALPKGHPYMVMEYVDGGTLLDKLNAVGRLGVEQAARLMQQVAAAVAQIHKLPKESSPSAVVHRDLKPANILLDNYGNAHVADFGLATAVADLCTGHATVGGTLLYMSPEQVAESSAVVDTRSDIWAMGVILYELLTGKHPIVGDSLRNNLRREEVLSRIRLGNYIRMGDVCADIPVEIEQLVDECLSVNVRERLKSADELVNRLRAWLDHAESARAMKLPTSGGVKQIGTPNGVTCLAFQPCAAGILLAAGDDRGRVELRRFASTEERRVIGSGQEGEGASVNSLTFSNDGKKLAFCAKNRIYVWDASLSGDLANWKPSFPPLETNRPTPEAKRAPHVLALSFSSNAQMLASCDGHEVDLWDAQAGQLRSSIVGIETKNRPELLFLGPEDARPDFGNVKRIKWTHVEYASDGKRIVLVDREGLIIVIKIASREWAIIADNDNVRDLCISPDGKLMAWSDNERIVKVTSLHASHGPGAKRVAKSPRLDRVQKSLRFFDDRLLASGGEDKRVRIWDCNAGLPPKEIASSEEATNAIRCVAVCRNANLIAYGSASNPLTGATIFVWDTTNVIRTTAGLANKRKP